MQHHTSSWVTQLFAAHCAISPKHCTLNQHNHLCPIHNEFTQHGKMQNAIVEWSCIAEVYLASKRVNICEFKLYIQLFPWCFLYVSINIGSLTQGVYRPLTSFQVKIKSCFWQYAEPTSPLGFKTSLANKSSSTLQQNIRRGKD